jgi:ribosomal protein L7/L12
MFEFIVTILLEVLGGLVEVSLSSIVEAFYTRQQREALFAERRMEMTISAQKREQIIHLWSIGKKIEAIKLYREVTGVGLREAKAAVDKIVIGAKEVPSELQTRLIDPNELRRLLRERKKIQAIKYYRETTGVGLREAKEAVEWVEEQMRQEMGSS